MAKVLDPRLLLMPLPVWIVGSYSAANRPNILAVSWAGVCCSEPPCVCIGVRPETFSFQGIIDHKAFTVGVPSTGQVREADYCGIVSGADVDKFERCGFSAIPCEAVHAPYVKELPISVACRVAQNHAVGSHTLIVGEILDTRVAKDCRDAAGVPLTNEADPILLAPATLEYFAVGRLVGHTYQEGRALHEATRHEPDLG